MEDIRYIILRHLPFVDRREFSLVCRAFKEPLQEVFEEYLRLGLTKALWAKKVYDEGGYRLRGDFMLWVVTELTLAGHYDWIDTTITAAPMESRYFNFMMTNLEKIMYDGHLQVKCWDVLLKRRAIIIPSFLYMMHDRFEAMCSLDSQADRYRKWGFTMAINYTMVCDYLGELAVKYSGSHFASEPQSIMNDFVNDDFLEPAQRFEDFPAKIEVY